MHEEFEILIEKRQWEELPPGEAARLERHLADCAQCLAIANLTRSQEQMLQDATTRAVAEFDWRAARRALDHQLQLRQATQVFCGLTLIAAVGFALYVRQLAPRSNGWLMPLIATIPLVVNWVQARREGQRLTTALRRPPRLREMAYFDRADHFDSTTQTQRILVVGSMAVLAVFVALTVGFEIAVWAFMGVMAVLFAVFLFLARRR